MSKLECVLVAILLVLVAVLGVLLVPRFLSGDENGAFTVTVSGTYTNTFDSGDIFYEFSESYTYEQKQLTFTDTNQLIIQSGSGDAMKVVSFSIPVTVASGTYGLTTGVDLSRLPVGSTVPGDLYTAAFYAPGGNAYIAAVNGQITFTKAGDTISGSFWFDASTYDALSGQVGPESVRVEGTFTDVPLKR